MNLLIKPFWFFGIEVAVQNKVGTHDYGFYFSLFNFAMLFNVVLDFGITNYNNREIARHNNIIYKYFANILGIKLILGVLYLILCFVVGIVFGYQSKELQVVLLLAVCQFLTSLILYLRSNINGMLLFVTDSFISVLDKALMIAICAFLLWGNIFNTPFRIEWFVWAQIVSLFITALIAYMVIANKKKINFKINWKYVLIIVKRSLPFTLLGMLMLLYSRMEPVLLERLLPDGKHQAGLYAQGYRILDVASNFAFLFPVILLPLFSKMLKERQDVQQLLGLSASILLLPAIVFATSCAMYSYEIMNLLYHSGESGLIFRLLILGFAGFSVNYIFGALLTANGSFKWLNLMAFSSVVLNIVLNLILIPLFSAKGAAITSITIQTLTGVTQIIMVIKIFRIHVSGEVIRKLFFFIGLYSLVLFGINTIEANWVFKLLSTMSAGILLMFICRIIKLKESLSLILGKA